MAKIKVTLSSIFEIDPENYPPGYTEQMMFDSENDNLDDSFESWVELLNSDGNLTLEFIP